MVFCQLGDLSTLVLVYTIMRLAEAFLCTASSALGRHYPLCLKQRMHEPQWCTVQVEHVALLSNAKDNGFLGVTMYCDDEAGIVNAPVNVRASEIASCAGKPLEVCCNPFKSMLQHTLVIREEVLQII